ncbi:phage tail family protein [Microbacterium resistens]|uniref:Phage tail family protein n=1 Tax=Microbacterium resistens TaxID=156977 RepID=A0ABY3RQI3_9MICO|nr:phage tail domain-containing protein [Microbacterium resistens]UGS26319.1 phage tail family protein [Microbacterium resistens]
MSFTFGTFNSDSLGLIATLRDLPSLGGLRLETLEAPGTDGLFFGGATVSSARYVFDVVIQGTTPQDAHGKRDALILALDPKRGERDLTFDAASGWRWTAIPSAPVEWERLTWSPRLYQLRGDVTFEALSGYGRLVDDEAWEYSSAGSRTVSRQKGNTVSYPTVEIQGTLSATQTVTVTVGNVPVRVSGPLTAAQVLRLDWDRFDFGRWQGATKVASVVRSMSTLDRPEMWPNTTTTFAVATTGTVTKARLRANSRRQ